MSKKNIYRWTPSSSGPVYPGGSNKNTPAYVAIGFLVLLILVGCLRGC